MIISIATMYQSPFDNTYANVPDFSTLSKYDETSFGRSLEFWLDNGKKKTIYPTAKSFTPNDREVIYATVTTNETLDYQSYNYCILLCKPDNDTITSTRYFYFIEDIVLINSLKESTLKITLSKDIWATYMAEIKNYTMPSQKIIRRHVPEFYSAGGDTYSDHLQENIVDKVIDLRRDLILPYNSPVQTTDDRYDILWVRLKLNPTLPLFIKVGDEYRNFKSTAYKYGLFKYVFFPIGYYIASGFRSDMIRINGETILALDSFVLPETDILISADLTFYPPFYYTCNYNIQEDILEVNIGDWESRTIYANNGNEYVPVLTGYASIGVTQERVYERIYNVSDIADVFDKNNPNVSLENLLRCHAFQYYPYLKYSIRCPDGSIITINSPRIVHQIVIHFAPTDSSIEYWIRCYDAKGEILTTEDTRTFAQATGSIPQTVSNYENFLLSSALKYSTQYEHSLNAADLRRDREVSANVSNIGQSIGQIGGGLGLMAVTGGALGGSNVGQGVSNIIKSGKNIYFAQREYNLETNYIKDLKQADMQQIKYTMANKPSATSDLGDWYFQDRFIVYKEFPVLYDHLKNDMAEFTYFGYNQSVLDNPLKNVRQYYDYVKIEGVLKPLSFIANPVHRNIFASILLEGTRKWHIDNYPNNFTTLDLDINGNEIPLEEA